MGRLTRELTINQFIIVWRAVRSVSATVPLIAAWGRVWLSHAGHAFPTRPTRPSLIRE